MTQEHGAPIREEHPEWALAYILTDWKRNRAVAKAYKAVCDEAEDAVTLTAEALRKCRVYVRALEEVVRDAEFRAKVSNGR